MDSTDRFYLDVASGTLQKFLNPGAGEFYFDICEQKYLDPLTFEAYIKDLPPHLWALEFRNAYDTIQEYIQRCCCDDLMDALTLSKKAIMILAKTYCPQIAEELESQRPVTNQVTKPVSEVTEPAGVAERVTNDTVANIPTLPKDLNDSPRARFAFENLVKAGFLDREYKPIEGMRYYPSVYSYLAYKLGEILLVSSRCYKIFGPHFGMDEKKMSQAKKQACETKNVQEWRTKIDTALKDWKTHDIY